MSSEPAPRQAAPARRRPGRPPAGTTVADRAQVIAAAAALVREKGPDVTMDDVAEAAGVSKPIVYRNVGDKAALAAALAEILTDRLNGSVERAAAAEPPGRESFAAGVRAMLQVIDEERNLFVFVNSGGPATEHVQRLVEKSSAMMIEQFRTSRRAAGLDPDVARTWAYAIVGALQVTAMMWLRDEYRSPEDVTADFTELMWSGLSATAPDPA